MAYAISHSEGKFFCINLKYPNGPTYGTKIKASMYKHNNLTKQVGCMKQNILSC